MNRASNELESREKGGSRGGELALRDRWGEWRWERRANLLEQRPVSQNEHGAKERKNQKTGDWGDVQGWQVH